MFNRPVRVALALVFLTTLFSSGCKRGFTASHADPEKSREILKKGLEAWKSGETPESLKSSASIDFNDPDWKKGLKLESYALQGDGQAFGHDWQCIVKLTLRDSKNSKTEKKATYDMSTSPNSVVARNLSR
jgi:hypothetical protein